MTKRLTRADLPLQWRQKNDQHLLLLGDVIVGRAKATGGRRNSARYIFHLAGINAFWRDAPSIEAAQAGAIAELLDWLRAAGLVA
jgi:O-acetyl-ADP-ribose deacetylase (regulator of RNase III)